VTTAERERTIALLSDRFAHGELEMEAFEERPAQAHRAQTAEDLAALRLPNFSYWAVSLPIAMLHDELRP
jgi:hypothetical protein